MMNTMYNLRAQLGHDFDIYPEQLKKEPTFDTTKEECNSCNPMIFEINPGYAKHKKIICEDCHNKKVEKK